MISNLLIKPNPSYENVIVEIEFENLTTPVEDYIFSLERSENKAGPWFYINDNIVLNYMTDNTIPKKLFRSGVSTFYRVMIRDKEGQKLSEYIKELSVANADRFALAIEANFKKYLDAQDMNDFVLLRRSKTSDYCHCFNDVRMESEDPDCPTCGGTGRVLGFIPGPELKVSIINPISQETLVKELFGEITLDMAAARAWTLGTYRIKTEDLLRNTFTNELFKVSSVNYSKRGSYVIRQAMTMSKVTAGDFLYRYIGGVI